MFVLDIGYSIQFAVIARDHPSVRSSTTLTLVVVDDDIDDADNGGGEKDFPLIHPTLGTLRVPGAGPA